MRTSVIDRLDAAWRRTDALFESLDPAALLSRPIPLRQPFVFYLGHLPAFAWNQVVRGVLGRGDCVPALDRLFERGIDPVGVDQIAAPDPSLWPAPKEVLAYRDRVRDAVRTAGEAVAARAADDPLARGERIFHLVLEHEAMHHETLLYMIQELDAAKKRAPAGFPRAATSAANGATNGAARGTPPRSVTVPAGRARLGASFEAVPFGWDNEFPAHAVDVATFSIDALPVSNAAFREFADAGGYARPEWWRPADFEWVERRGLRRPHAWVERDGALFVKGAYEEIPFAAAADRPVQVSWAEAAAYARSKGRRLPTEAEWHRATFGDRDPAMPGGNYGFRAATPAPSGLNGSSSFGVHDLVGDGWEWTSTPFGPFDGFTPWARTYPGYSKDFFDGGHFVLKGASWATDPVLVRPSFRNWFQPHYPWVFSKFRMVKS
jgi:ergothioneine biosynthesis protein EgtB